MKPAIFGILRFFKLIDDSNQLSLTNIALIIVIVKLAMIQQASMMDLGTLLLALANYNIKKYLALGTLSTSLTTIKQDITRVVTKDEEAV